VERTAAQETKTAFAKYIHDFICKLPVIKQRYSLKIFKKMIFFEDNLIERKFLFVFNKQLTSN